MAMHRRPGQRGPEEKEQRAQKAHLVSTGPVSSPDVALPGLLQRAATQPHYLTPGGVQTLQRAYGNRATRQLVQRSRGHSPRPVLPQLRTDHGSGEGVIQAIRSIGSEGYTTKRRLKYGECLVRGKKIWGMVKKSFKGRGAPSDITPYTGDLGRIDASESKLPDTETTVMEDFDNVGMLRVMTSGTRQYKYKLKKGESKTTPDFDNSIDPQTGRIKATGNFKRGYPLANSEVLWKQYKLALRVAAGKADTTEGLNKDVQKIVRSNVVNKDTRNVAVYSTNSDEELQTGVQYTPGQGEFFAMLGTPNAQSAGYMLKDHNKHMAEKKTIESISVQGNPGSVNLEIPFKKKTGCFITTACTSARGLADDCDELTTLRQFRDGYMRGLERGNALIDLYYDIAPQVVAAIGAQENAKQVYDHLYSVIRACVEHVKNGRNEKALAIYVEMVKRLARQYCPHLLPAAS